MFNIQNDLLKERRNFNVKSLFYFKLFFANFKPAVPMQVNKLQFSTLNSNFITFFISECIRCLLRFPPMGLSPTCFFFVLSLFL